MDPRTNNIGAYISAPFTLTPFSAVAADGTVDNVEQAGVIIDRNSYGMAMSATLLIPYHGTLTIGETLKVGYRVEHGEDAALGDTTDFAKVLIANGLVFTAAGGKLTASGVVKVDLDLAGAKRYLRVNVTTDLSKGATDISQAAAQLVLGGEDRLPAV